MSIRRPCEDVRAFLQKLLGSVVWKELSWMEQPSPSDSIKSSHLSRDKWRGCTGISRRYTAGNRESHNNQVHTQLLSPHTLSYFPPTHSATVSTHTQLLSTTTNRVLQPQPCSLTGQMFTHWVSVLPKATEPVTGSKDLNPELVGLPSLLSNIVAPCSYAQTCLVTLFPLLSKRN